MTDPLPPADYESDPYYSAEPPAEEDWDSDEWDDELWDATVGYWWDVR